MLYCNINGVFRQAPEVSSKINGIWRKHKKIFEKLNGIFRKVYDDEGHLDTFIVKDFIVRYKLNKFRKHPEFPNLRYNKNIPHNFQLSGESVNELDLSPKSVIFEYNNQNYNEEGLLMYEGNIYLRTISNEEIDIGEIPIDYRLFEHDITISCETVDENYGYEIHGWNSIYSSEQFLHSSGIPNVINQYHNRVNDLIISPEWKRNENYNTTLDIGIAREYWYC